MKKDTENLDILLLLKSQPLHRVAPFSVPSVIEYDFDEVPDDWDKDWNNLTFDERIVLCEKYDVIYMATRVITIDKERKI